MKKRLTLALAAGALVAAMVPGAASAEPKGPPTTVFGTCAQQGVRPHDLSIGTVGPVTSLSGVIRGPGFNNTSSPFEGGYFCGFPVGGGLSLPG